MNRREFILASTAAAGLAGCATASSKCDKGGFLFGACRPLSDAKLLKEVGFDFVERDVASSLMPTKGGDDWKRQRDYIAGLAVPLRSCNGFIPGKFRLTGPNADFAPALDYAEIAVRRAEEVGVKTIVFGSGGARNVPGDYLAKNRKDHPNVEEGARQYTEFCSLLCKRVSDLKSVAVVIEPLRPNESNIVNFVWQGVQICNDVGSPRLQQLADIFHMMMGRETPDSIRQAGALLKHCHVAEHTSRMFPGNDPALNCKLKPYFDALRDIGYAGGISCECGWGKKEDLAKNLEKALAVLKSL
jgi:sugar phosphate isomerase/epimerase